MKQEIPEVSLCLSHWFLRVWEFGASGSSLTRNVKPASPANCHGKVREVKKNHFTLWTLAHFLTLRKQLLPAKAKPAEHGVGTESQTDRVALAAAPDRSCVPCAPQPPQWGKPNFLMLTPIASQTSARFYLQKKSLRQEGDEGCQSLTLCKDNCATFLWL